MTAALMMSKINKYLRFLCCEIFSKENNFHELKTFYLNFSLYLKFLKRFGEKTVSILLDGEESELIFIDHPASEMSVSFSFPFN
jgi:hypothetical protein